MIKKVLLLLIVLGLCSTGLSAFEVGLIGGTITNPNHSVYGVSGSMGFLVPMVKFELELYKIHGTEFPELPNAITGGIKFRPKLGKFAPYAVLGAGVEFDSLGFDFDDYEKFTFIAGGVYFYITGMISLRGDIRFHNYSGYNRTRLSAGIFFHF
jgi:hypothetical protein